jgi:hypothetical protein
MIVYLETAENFCGEVNDNKIEERIKSAVRTKLHKSVSDSEIRSWRNSMQYMRGILSDKRIPKEAGVAIEFSIPQTSKRIDFILTGVNREHRRSAVIIELKQWEEAHLTGKDGIVKTFVGGGERETPHPSYQAWSYAALLEDFNEAVREEPIDLRPCAYLHNCKTDSIIKAPFYSDHLRKAPAFTQGDVQELRDFISKHLHKGDKGEAMYLIQDGRIRPSKNLADSLAGLLKGNDEFIMIDDQKLVYETALYLSGSQQDAQKHVLVVKGGPGTGKSVVAINLLVELTARGKVAKYVTKNSAPRDVYQSKLTGKLTKTRFNNLFTGSGVFHDVSTDAYDVLIVDEAHRLNEKSGMFHHLGENQIKEIISSSKFSIFFIDEDQRVHFKDIGRVSEIQKWATAFNANLEELSLNSQFRCNGSDGYLSWLDHSLSIRETANPTLEGINYDFRVCESPQELRSMIREKNAINNRARMVAGYCWNWVSQKDAKAMDITFSEYDFGARWNLKTDGMLWILKPTSVDEIGCIHTCQGLEMDYVGVIIGPDLIVRNGEVITDATKRAKTDKSITGFKKLHKKNSIDANQLADEIIKNTYRTLMTRGQKGCFIWSPDLETREYFKGAIGGISEALNSKEPYPGLPLRILDPLEVKPFVNCVPVFDLPIAAGNFGQDQIAGTPDWVELPEGFTHKEGFFVVRVCGESMNRRIPNGSWCLFRANPAGSRQGKVVIVCHHSIQDPENGGSYTVKIYESVKRVSDESWRHQQIQLHPDSNTPGFRTINIESDDSTEFNVIGEFVANLGKV